MTRRRSALLAWSLLAAAVALELATIAFELASERELAGFLDYYFSVGVLSFALVGAVVAARLPANPIGWLFLGLGLFSALSLVAEVLATNAVLDGSAGTSAQLASWIASWGGAWIPPTLIVFLLLLFPTGRLGRTERWIGRLAGLTFGLGALSEALAPGPLEAVQLDNPFPVESAALGPVGTAAELALPAVFGLAAASLLLRLRRAGGRERLQLKWFAYACALMVAVVIANNVLYRLFSSGGLADILGSIAFSVPLFAIPATVGIAMLRHRLYDIDLVINRTLVYGALTACLALFYWLGVVSLGQLLGPITSESDLAIAGSTLAVAALFRPLRGRIQAAVDRRFYRRRYDAARTLDAFARHLRDEVALDALSSELRAVVAETMQPVHVQLWLRAAEVGSPARDGGVSR